MDSWLMVKAYWKFFSRQIVGQHCAGFENSKSNAEFRIGVWAA